MSENINYARLFGIESVAAAVVFAVLYVPLLGWFVRQSIGRPTYVFLVLSLFCAIRISAFIIRAILAGSDSAGRNLSLLIADEVLLSVGFFGLLYSAYTLVLDRELISDAPPTGGIISSITRNRRLFRLAMVAAVALGVAGSSQSSSTNPQDGTTLRKVSVIIFLVLTVLLGYQTFVLVKTEMSTGGRYKPHGSWGTQYAAYILSLIALLLLIREIFATATMGSLTKQNNEHFWYPLIAVPEIIAVVLYATPDLVPPRSELPTSRPEATEMTGR